MVQGGNANLVLQGLSREIRVAGLEGSLQDHFYPEMGPCEQLQRTSYGFEGQQAPPFPQSSQHATQGVTPY